jgi:hypothetical protein
MRVIRELQHGEGTQLERMEDGGHAGVNALYGNPFEAVEADEG